MAKRVQWGRPEYFIQWQSYPPSENTLEPAEHLPEELITVFEKRCVDPFHTDECQERLEREGFKIASGMQQNYHDVARCSLSALPWFTIRPLWVFIPHQWRGTDSSGPWSLSEEVFNSNRQWMLCWCSSQLEAASWQVALLRRWTRPHNSSLPSRESSNQVYKELFCWMHPARQMLLLWKRPL